MLKKILSLCLAVAVITLTASSTVNAQDEYYVVDREINVDLIDGHLVYFKKSLIPGRSDASLQTVMDTYFTRGPDFQKNEEYYKLCNTDERSNSIEKEGIYFYFGQLIFVKVGAFYKDKGELIIVSYHANPEVTREEYKALKKEYLEKRSEYMEYEGPPREFVPTAVNDIPTGFADSKDAFIEGTYYDWRRD